MQPNKIKQKDYRPVSPTAVNLLLKSPREYWYFYLNPDAPPRESTAEQILGQHLHTLVLEPQRFKKDFIILPKISRNEKSKEWQAYLKEAGGREIIFDDEYKKICDMCASINDHKEAMEWLAYGKIENAIFWRDKSTKVACTGRPDLYNEYCVVDIKTVASGLEEKFSSSISSFGYHRQGAMYIDGVNAILKKNIDTLVFICVEKKPPYLTSVFNLRQDDIKIGRIEYKGALETFKRCKKENHWPSNREKIKEVGLPRWYKADISLLGELNDEPINAVWE